MLLPKYACFGDIRDREMRNYRVTPLPKNGSTYEFNCLLLLDRLVLYPCLHFHSDRSAVAHTSFGSRAGAAGRCTNLLTTINALTTVGLPGCDVRIAFGLVIRSRASRQGQLRAAPSS